MGAEWTVEGGRQLRRGDGVRVRSTGELLDFLIGTAGYCHEEGNKEQRDANLEVRGDRQMRRGNG